VIQHQNKGRFAQRLAKFQHTHLTETRLDTEIRLCLQGNRARGCRPRAAYGMPRNDFYNYYDTTAGTIEIELGGTAPDASDRFAVIGTLYAGGTLTVSLIDGFRPASGDTFDILDFSAVDGVFETLDLPGSTANWDLAKLYTTGEIRYRPVGTVLMVQ